MNKAEIETLLNTMPFVNEFGITVKTVEPGRVTVIMPYAKRFSATPNVFPATLVGAIGDVAAICSCLSLQQLGWAVATLDFTVKITNPPKGEFLSARGDVLHSGKTLSTASSTIWAHDGDDRHHCGAVLVSGRNFKIG